MAEMMRLQIVTPDEAFFDGEVSMVELNTADGETGIYPKHIPMVVAVAPGVLYGKWQDLLQLSKTVMDDPPAQADGEDIKNDSGASAHEQ